MISLGALDESFPCALPKVTGTQASRTTTTSATVAWRDGDIQEIKIGLSTIVVCMDYVDSIFYTLVNSCIYTIVYVYT